jgi:hypothetical protein
LTYSPLPDGLGPKLLPTVPVHVQVFPALLVHCAVAVAPTVRQLTARFSRISGVGEAVITPARARNSAVEKSIVTNDVRER